MTVQSRLWGILIGAGFFLIAGALWLMDLLPVYGITGVVFFSMTFLVGKYLFKNRR